ncbi:MAG TPA: hypothetical protein ENJ64_06945 [Thiotrichales bacterium]|nr:hypothetical protein [Thiotrichales bacterium]
MGFISKFLLPDRVDFDAALLKQAQINRLLVSDLYKACANDDREALNAISIVALRERKVKVQNMEVLLDVFITPYDKESIYRMITQLDWITLSVKHFQLEAEVYDTHSLSEYEPVLKTLLEMATALEDGMSKLASKDVKIIFNRIDQIHDQYDHVVESCARATGKLLQQDDYKRIIRHKDMLLQLKEIAKRIHISANTLEDMAIKIV